MIMKGLPCESYSHFTVGTGKHMYTCYSHKSINSLSHNLDLKQPFENIVEKTENGSNHRFLFYTECFQPKFHNSSKVTFNPFPNDKF